MLSSNRNTVAEYMSGFMRVRVLALGKSVLGGISSIFAIFPNKFSHPLTPSLNAQNTHLQQLNEMRIQRKAFYFRNVITSSSSNAISVSIDTIFVL